MIIEESAALEKDCCSMDKKCTGSCCMAWEVYYERGKDTRKTGRIGSPKYDYTKTTKGSCGLTSKG